MESIVESERPNLASNDRVALRETIDRIEARISSRAASEQQVAGESSNGILLLHLIRVGLELQNIELLLISVARLKLGQLALILQSASQSLEDKSKLFALSYVAEHFHMEYPRTRQQLMSLTRSDCDTIHDLKSIVKLYIGSNEWKRASEFIKGSPHSRPLDRLICLRIAQQYETTENFYEALVNYEASETQVENSVRVVIKQFLDLSRAKLREYCLTNESLGEFWNEFSLFCPTSSSSSLPTLESRADHFNGGLPHRLGSGLLRTNPKSDRESPTIRLPERMKKFLDESNNLKHWSNRRTIEGIICNAACLDSSVKRHLLSRALHARECNHSLRAGALFLCLDESMVVSQISLRFLGHSDASKLNLFLGLSEASAVNLLRTMRLRKGSMTTNHQLSAQARDSSGRNYEPGSVFFSALNLGLMDETMRSFCDICPTNEDTSKLILDRLEKFIAARHTGALDQLDPTIRAATLALLRHRLALEKFPAAPVISIIIYCMAIYTYKFEYSHFVSIPIEVMRTLEAMFEHTGDCLKRHSFDASGSLVRSTSTLVTAIKDKLEIVSDSEIIRVGLGNLVDAVASRCLVESQFRQAATLYSQIEDHASAIKALMRLGDIDTVMNYSLLVRDITVYRLTINYLKHLDVDSTTIEEFITKSKR